MAERDREATWRLFRDFLAPLVLGGELRAERAIGSRRALAMRDEPGASVDAELLERVQTGRVRVARRLAPVDAFDVPTPAEWALGASLHDILLAAHPGFDAVLRRSAPARLLMLAEATLARVPAPKSVGEALSRHTWFARLFEIQRTDTLVSWWVGSRAFLGEEPPPRLLAWPAVRRVHVEKFPRTIVELPSSGGAVDPHAFERSLVSFLDKTPLTDLATCERASPPFAWGGATLGLVATAAGRTLATRALSHASSSAVDAALGRATRALVAAHSWAAAWPALHTLAERALADAMAKGNAEPQRLPPGGSMDDASYARGVGADVACERLRRGGEEFREADRADLLARLTPLARFEPVRELEAALPFTSSRR